MNHSPAFLRLVDAAKARVREVTVEDLLLRRAEEGAGPLVLDVREESEWAAGHIEGARYLGRGVLERDIEALVPELDRELVLYCGGGFRSALSADSLQQMGFRSVASLAGGWKAWRAAGGPVVIP
jgi:rhodanese-related sulfurtransferase